MLSHARGFRTCTWLMPLLVAGCATASQTYLADGRLGYSINCPGAANSWGSCLQRAGEICGPKGYDVVDQSGRATPFVIANANANGGMATGGSIVTRNLMIACKP